MSSNPSPAPTLLAVRIDKNTAEVPQSGASGQQILGRAQCALCHVEYLITAIITSGHAPAVPQQKAQQIVLLTHPRHPQIIDLENPWG